MLGSSRPPSATMRIPSEVLVVPRLPKKKRFRQSSPLTDSRRSMTGCGRAWAPMVKYVGSATEMSPARSEVTSASSSGVAVSGLAKRSPRAMATEKSVLV